ncbi:MAG: glutathione S-transferase family protein [Rhodospirillales bacterium]|nr:glutathione S-transferase family protein [Rhodospirillales bacterium]
MAQVTLYGSPLSTYVRTARIALAEKGVNYEHVDVWPNHPELHKRHPFARMPALQHGDFELYETIAIARYVDEAFPGPALQPSDIKARARMAQWVSVLNSYCYPTIIGRLVIERVAPKLLNRPADEEKVKAAVPDAEHHLGVLEKGLGAGPYFAGREPSLADYFLYPVLFYLSITPEGAQLLERKPALRRWMEAMGERKSVKETTPSL